MFGARGWAAWLLAGAALADAPDYAHIERLIARGDFAQAWTALSPLPVDGARWHLLASKIHDGLGDPKRAVDEAEAALAIDPKRESHHLQLGQIFLGRNTPQAAFDIFTEALPLFPESLLLRLGRGLALKDLQRYEEAERDLRECLDRRPGFPLAFDGLATVLLHQKRYARLVEAADAQRRRVPSDFRGHYYAAAGREGSKTGVEQALAMVRESVRLNPAFAASRALLGKLLLARNDTAGAIRELDEALQLRPDYTPAAMHLAQAYQRAGRREDAARAFANLKELKRKENEPRPSLVYRRRTP